MTTPGPAPYALVCDFGSAWTKTTLFGTVGGARRLVATRSFPTPTLDGIRPDLDAATVQAEHVMRELTGAQVSGSLEGSQDDLRVRRVPVGSSAPPMSLVVVCVDAKAARHLADQIRAASYIGEIHAGSIAGLLNPWTIRDGYRPDLVLLVEGRTPLTPAQQQALDRLLTRLGTDTRQVVVLHCVPEGIESGATALLSRTEAVTVRCDLLASPPHGLAAVGRQLLLQYSRHSSLHASETEQLPSGTDASFLSAAACAMISARYAADTAPGGLLLLDIGSSSIVVCAAAGDNLSYKVLGGFGVGRGSPALYEQVGRKNLRRWLPFEPYRDELSTWALNRSIHPTVEAPSLREALIEQAFAREAVRLAIAELALDVPPRVVVGSGGLARGMGSRVAAVVVADAMSQVHPNWRRTEIVIDEANAFVAVGALATIDPDLAGDVWERDRPRTKTILLAARGAKRGEPAVSVTASWEDGSEEITVPEGRLERIHGPLGRDTRVVLSPLRGVKMQGTGRKRSQIAALAVRDDITSPELLLDTRTVAIRDEGRHESVAQVLVSSGAFSEAKLGTLGMRSRSDAPGNEDGATR